jgi:CheY-like chemotaxis protein
MPKKILLADDSITIQKVVELTFSDGDYEVIAVNNGAKAIAKLGEVRPDIILSDIIMPEKNGYEVCEYVKSHPEYRNIPVILLTGTFEPFDPDRADKAGCDAVVTKPFESQSLIHKVEELIHQSQSSPAAEESQPAPAAHEMFADAPSFEPPPAPAADEPFAHDNDIFAAAAPAAPNLTADMPFDTPEEPAFGNETRALPRMSFEEMQQMANQAAQPAAHQEPAPVPEASPWDEAPSAFGGETRAFPRMSFEDMQQMAPAAQSAPVAEPEATDPFGEAPAAPAEPEASPWDEPKGDASTRAFPMMSFDEMRKMAEESKPAPAPFEEPAAPPPVAEASPWDEPPAAFGGETRAFPRMSFGEMEKMASQASAPAAPTEPQWAPQEAVPVADPFAEPEQQTESPFAMAEPAHEETPESSSPAPAVSEAAAEPAVNSQITDAATAPAEAPSDLTDAQVERIARIVVKLMSDKVIRDIAWEVIPDVAEMLVKERIRQLEAEA